MRVLSLFDGMACGMLAMLQAGVEVDKYVAFEIDKYAVQTSSHNFPIIEHRGDVFEADFTEFEGFDFLVGGSPCTYWSIAQKNNRETEASGMGWELFSQYVRALHEAKPMYFIYENNKSMSNAIRQSITETFGFEPVCINSALVSAQNRQRLYWVGKRNEDGTYRKVKVDQPEDRGISLRDILEGGAPINTTEDGKAWTIKSQYYKNGIANLLNDNTKGCQYTASGVAEPIRVGALPKPNGELSQSQGFRIYSTEGKSVCLKGEAGGAGGKTGLYAIPVEYDSVHPSIGELTHTCDCNVTAEGTLRVAYTDKSESQGYRVYSTEHKSVCLRYANGRGTELIADRIPGLAVPCEWDEIGKPTKAISAADGKIYQVYEVKDGQITIRGKSYPIKLIDGFYIIRKLTVSECMRLQTVPEWYEFPVSDSQAYKMLGNGWTVDVIAHLIQATQEEVIDGEQLNLFQTAMWG